MTASVRLLRKGKGPVPELKSTMADWSLVRCHSGGERGLCISGCLWSTHGVLSVRLGPVGPGAVEGRRALVMMSKVIAFGLGGSFA